MHIINERKDDQKQKVETAEGNITNFRDKVGIVLLY